MAKQQDQVFIQNFIIILVMLFGMIAIFVIIARTVGSNEVTIAKQRALVIAEKTQPIGSVRRSGGSGEDSTGTQTAATGMEAETAPADIGKKVYDGLCFSCHGTGLPNIPQVGMSDQWADRIAQGTALMYERAINGFTGKSGMAMPAKGGNATLSDEEVKAAVDHMIANSQ
jgi:cytochrome c5